MCLSHCTQTELNSSFELLISTADGKDFRNQVTIEDLSPEVVQEVLTFVYTGQSPNLKGMSADLLRAADKYDLKQLKAWSLAPGNARLGTKQGQNERIAVLCS